MASKTSSKLVPRTASMECSVSWPIEASPATVPAARLTTTPPVTLSSETELIEHTIEAAAAVNIVVAAAPLKDFRPGDVVAAQQRVIERRSRGRL